MIPWNVLYIFYFLLHARTTHRTRSAARDVQNTYAAAGRVEKIVAQRNFGWCENTLNATFSCLMVNSLRPTVRPLIASEKTTFFLSTWLIHKVLLLNSLRAHFGRNPLVLAATAKSKTRKDSLERALHFLFSYARTYNAPYALRCARRPKHVCGRPAAV